MKRAIAIASLVVGAGWVTTAWADSPNIKGSYAFTGSGVCLWAPGSAASPPPPTNTTPLPNAGFCNGVGDPSPGCTAQGHPVDGKVFSTSFVVEGIRTFDGNGNGTVSGSELTLNVPPTPQAPGYPAFPPSASTNNFSYQFTYTVDNQGGWTATVVPGSFNVNHVLGGRAGQTSTVANFPHLIGAISDNGKVLELATADPNSLTVETVSFSNGDVWPRICNRSRVLIQLQNGNGGH